MTGDRQAGLAILYRARNAEQNRGDPAMERAAATWRGEYWKTGTGGAVWDSITFEANSTASIWAPAMPAPPTPRCAAPAAATISTPPRSSRSTPIPAGMSGITRSIRAMPGITTDAANDAGGTRHRREAPRRTDAGAEERLLLRARPDEPES